MSTTAQHVTKSKVIRMYRAGDTIDTISQHTGLEHSVIRGYLLPEGLMEWRFRVSHSRGPRVRIKSEIAQDNRGRPEIDILRETVLSTCLWLTQDEPLAQAAVRRYLRAVHDQPLDWWKARCNRSLRWWLGEIAALEVGGRRAS